MPRKSTSGFIWSEAQMFIGVDGHIVTSYTNNDLTISFAQDNEGNLLGFVYETEETKGEVTFTEDSVSEKITTVS